MKINSARVLRTDKFIELSITYKRKRFDVFVTTENGHVRNVDKGVSTAYLIYFNEDANTLKEHMKQIVDYVENNFD